MHRVEREVQVLALLCSLPEPRESAVLGKGEGTEGMFNSSED